MSRDKPTDSLPFGYTLNELASGASSSSYPPPAERPLLHDEENNFLESFFNDPNNIDPNSLLSMSSGEYQGDPSALYGTAGIDWPDPTTGEFLQNPTDSPQASGQGTRSAEWHDTSNLEPINEPSADVFAAAGILHNKNTNTNSGSRVRATDSGSTRLEPDIYSNNTVAVPASSTDASGDAMNGYSYPPLNPSTGPPYNFEPATQPTSNLYDMSPTYAQAETTNPYLAGLQSRLTAATRGASATPSATGPLAFGSDDNFRSTYVAPPAETPDKPLEEATYHNFAENSKAHRQRRPPTAPMRKRSRLAQDSNGAASSNVEDTSYDEDDGSHKRRREDDDIGGDKDQDSQLGKKGKRRQTSATAGAVETKEEPASPGKRPRTLGSLIKPGRENLTEEQKRNNHIQSEQKRRNLIKQGFDDLNRMVPELRSASLSKSGMLVESAKFMRSLRDLNEELRAQLQGLDKG